MAKQRYIKPKFWSDAYIQGLDANTKLLYLYLMTNEHNNIAGIYEITEKTMCFEISYPMHTLSRGIDKLSKDGKIIYMDGWMILKNHVKNQNFIQENTSVNGKQKTKNLITNMLNW